MSSTSLYTLVAGASLLLALWQPADADTPLASTPRSGEMGADHAQRASQRIDDSVARHKERWEQRKARHKTAGDGS